MSDPAMGGSVLSVQNLSVGFQGRQLLQVTEDVSFSIEAGQVFALVGESGCGKSVTAMALLRLLPVPGARILGGTVKLNGRSLLDLDYAELVKVRGKQAACVFQEPMQALDPVVRVGRQLREALRSMPHAQADDKIRSLLQEAGLTDPDRVMQAYPHELSGGMLQRVVLCMALLPEPALLIADEPTTALDVTVQAQVMTILRDMCRRRGTAVLLITHNMGLVAQYAHQVAVMYAGRMVEQGPVAEVLKNPAHPYTVGLLRAIPEKHASVGGLQAIPGAVPAPENFSEGCRFRERCSLATETCLGKPMVSVCAANHWVWCWHSRRTHGPE